MKPGSSRRVGRRRETGSGVSYRRKREADRQEAPSIGWRLTTVGVRKEAEIQKSASSGTLAQSTTTASLRSSNAASSLGVQGFRAARYGEIQVNSTAVKDFASASRSTWASIINLSFCAATSNRPGEEDDDGAEGYHDVQGGSEADEFSDKANGGRPNEEPEVPRG